MMKVSLKKPIFQALGELGKSGLSHENVIHVAEKLV
jgi:hypothetical protein